MNLTKQQALDQGYTLFSYGNDGYSQLYRIEVIGASDFEGNKLFVAEKESYYTPSISSDGIADILADQVYSEVGDETKDDSADDVYDIVKALDFTDAAERVNAALAHKKYYRLTDIQIIPG